MFKRDIAEKTFNPGTYSRIHVRNSHIVRNYNQNNVSQESTL